LWILSEILQQLRFGQGFALSRLAITAHQYVTLLTDTTRSFVC
jgi:hypothetical protein